MKFKAIQHLTIRNNRSHLVIISKRRTTEPNKAWKAVLDHCLQVWLSFHRYNHKIRNVLTDYSLNHRWRIPLEQVSLFYQRAGKVDQVDFLNSLERIVSLESQLDQSPATKTNLHLQTKSKACWKKTNFKTVFIFKWVASMPCRLYFIR